MIYRKMRNDKGQALVEGATALVLIIMGTVLASLFLLNVGLGVFYKEKLGFIADQSAKYASALPAAQADKGAKDIAAQLISEMKLPIKNTQVTVDNSDAKTIQVSISGQCAMFNNSLGVLPLQISLSDTASAVKSSGSSGGSFAGYLKGVGAAGDIYVPFSYSNPIDPGAEKGITKIWPN